MRTPVRDISFSFLVNDMANHFSNTTGLAKNLAKLNLNPAIIAESMAQRQSCLAGSNDQLRLFGNVSSIAGRIDRS